MTSVPVALREMFPTHVGVNRWPVMTCCILTHVPHARGAGGRALLFQGRLLALAAVGRKSEQAARIMLLRRGLWYNPCAMEMGTLGFRRRYYGSVEIERET